MNYIQGVMYQTFPLIWIPPTVFVPGAASPQDTFYSKSRGNYADYFSASRGRVYYSKQRD